MPIPLFAVYDKKVDFSEWLGIRRPDSPSWLPTILRSHATHSCVSRGLLVTSPCNPPLPPTQAVLAKGAGRGRESRAEAGGIPTPSLPMFQAKITTAKPPMEWFLQANCTKLTQPEEPFFTFARPHPKQQEPSEAAGKERCSDKALQEQALPIPLAAMQLQDSS